MKTSRKTENRILDKPGLVLATGILGILLGIFFIVSQKDNKPIVRADALSYSGQFDHYDTAWKNYREIHFEDGSVYEVYPHTESSEFREKMKSLEKGTKLHLLVNPNNNFVIEVKTDTEELLNFELSQQEIDSYDNGYIGIGIFACVAGVFLLIFSIARSRYKQKEAARHAERKEVKAKVDTPFLRYAEEPVKSRILLEARVQGYQICYRRVKSTNELVINGRVYDEKKGIIEFAHKLCATVDGHEIEAGYDSDSYSYILFDGEMIQRKIRLI